MAAVHSTTATHCMRRKRGDVSKSRSLLAARRCRIGRAIVPPMSAQFHKRMQANHEQVGSESSARSFTERRGNPAENPFAGSGKMRLSLGSAARNQFE